MNRIEVIRGELRRSLSGDAWHGPSLVAALGDVTPGEAVARPVGGAHTIEELALHGLAQHNAYHGGQITLLKLAQRRRAAPGT